MHKRKLDSVPNLSALSISTKNASAASNFLCHIAPERATKLKQYKIITVQQRTVS